MRLLLVLIALLALAACGGDQTIVTEPSAPAAAPAEETEEEAEEEEEEAAAEDVTETSEPGIGDTLVLQGYEPSLVMEVTPVKVVDPAEPSDEFLAPEEGNRYVAIRFRISNIGDDVYDDSPSNGAAVVDRQDQQYSASIFDAVAPALGAGLKIRPGDSRAGFITFEVPKKAKLRTLQFTLESGFGPESGEWSLR